MFLDALLHRHLVWLRPGLLPLLFFLWRVHVRMALGDVIASMPLVKQGLSFTCRGGALASLATGVRQCTCVCVCVSINRCQCCPWQAIVAAAAVRGTGATLAGATFFLLCCRPFWLRPWLLSSLFIGATSAPLTAMMARAVVLCEKRRRREQRRRRQHDGRTRRRRCRQERPAPTRRARPTASLKKGK